MTDDQSLVAAALEARRYAYVPYSHYAVGAAILTADGTIFTGCNVENAAYGGTICAERTAAVKAVSEGRQRFITVAVVTENGGAPCGACRQFLYEFGRDTRVIVADAGGAIQKVLPLTDLLPHGFGPEFLDETKRT